MPRTDDAPLEKRECRFDAVGRDVPVNISPGGVVDVERWCICRLVFEDGNEVRSPTSQNRDVGHPVPGYEGLQAITIRLKSDDAE